MNIPVICDRCRTTGHAGEDPFADLADLLSFTPVPRRAHVNGWDGEMQRAFIAALATTGSPRRAARALGKHAFGAEQLRKARGGASFAAAWDAALELSRERELAALKDSLTELAAEQDEEHGRRRSAILPRAERERALPPEPAAAHAPRGGGSGSDDEDYYSDEAREELAAAKLRIRERLTRARRLLLMGYADDAAKRAAWETLVGPVDWERATRGESQPDEPFDDSDGFTVNHHSFHKPDMLLTAEAHLLPDITGGEDAMEGLAQEVAAIRAEQEQARESDPLPPEEQAALDAHREKLKADGWTEDDEGSLWSPEEEQ